MKDTMPTAATFFRVVQFMGFAGSFGPSQVTMLGSLSASLAAAGVDASMELTGSFSTSCSGRDSVLVEDLADPGRPVGVGVDMKKMHTARCKVNQRRSETKGKTTARIYRSEKKCVSMKTNGIYWLPFERASSRRITPPPRNFRGVQR